MSSKCDSDYDDRSSGGSDSEGSLVDFIMADEDEEEPSSGEETNDDNADAALVNEFPYDPSLLKECADASGPRRSRRERKAPERYVDDKYAQLMFDDVEMSKLEASSDDDGAAIDGESEDDDYEQTAEEESDDCSSESEAENDEDWHDEEPESNNEQEKEDASEAGNNKTATTAKPPMVEVLLTDPPTVVSAKRPITSMGPVVPAKKPKVA